MRMELVLFFATGFIVWYIYTDGKYVKQAMAHKKYLQMAGVVVGAIFLYWLIKKNPNDATKMLLTTNEYIKYLPVDRSMTSYLSPILDFTAKHTFADNGLGLTAAGMAAASQPILAMPTSTDAYAQRRIQTSGLLSGGGNAAAGGKATKRSVSETKKKFVAARQNWKCGQCREMLQASFEIDHTIRLEHGGSNHIDNLVALCRNCHGMKTAVENL